MTGGNAPGWEPRQSGQRLEQMERQNSESRAIIAALRQEASSLRSTLRQYEANMRDLDEKLQTANVAAAQKAKADLSAELKGLSEPLVHENQVLHGRLEQQEHLIISLQRVRSQEIISEGSEHASAKIGQRELMSQINHSAVLQRSVQVHESDVN